jgi:hypothetical protein
MSTRSPLPSTLFALALLPLFLGGSCADTGESGGCTSVGDDDDTPLPPPPPRIIGVGPTADGDDVAPTARIWARFDVAPASATLTVDGVTGDIETTESGRRIMLFPAEPLDPSTPYTATVSWTWDDGEDTAPWTFTTGPYGTPLDGPAEGALIGANFHLNLGDADFTSPEGIGGVLGGVLSANPLMFSFMDTSNLALGDVHLLGAVGIENSDPVEQDLCTPTLHFTYGEDGALDGGDDNLATWDNPNLVMEGSDLQLVVNGNDVEVRDMSLSAVFHPDGDRFASGTFTGSIDARDIGDLTETICELAECIPCDSDGEPFCLDLAAENVSGPAFDFAIVPRTCVQIIDDDLGGVSCEDAAESFAIEGEAGYPKCPEWVENVPGR